MTHLLKHPRDQLLHEPHHCIPVHERHLHVQLSELRLPVGAQVFIAEAASNLQSAETARLCKAGTVRSIVLLCNYRNKTKWT